MMTENLRYGSDLKSCLLGLASHICAVVEQIDRGEIIRNVSFSASICCGCDGAMFTEYEVKLPMLVRDERDKRLLEPIRENAANGNIPFKEFEIDGQKYQLEDHRITRGATGAEKHVGGEDDD